MEVGILAIFQNYQGKYDDAEMVRNELRIADLAEPLGFDTFWPTEHHFTDYSACPDNLQLLSYLAVSGLFITTALTYTGGLQGTGDTKGPLYISIVSQIVIPLGICFVVDLTRGLQPGDIWLAIVIGHLTRAGLSIVRFRQGKWRNIEVKIAPGGAEA